MHPARAAIKARQRHRICNLSHLTMLSPTKGGSIGLSHLPSKHADALRLTSNIILISHQGVNSSRAQHQPDFSASRQQSQHPQSHSPPKREICSLTHHSQTRALHTSQNESHSSPHYDRDSEGVLIQVYHSNLHRTHLTHTNGYILSSHALI